MITRWFNFVFIILVHIQRNKKAAARQRILKPFQLLGNMTIIWSDIFGKHPKDSSTPWRTENSLLQHRRYMSGVNRGQTLKKTYSSKECLLKRRTWQLGNSALRNFLMMIPSGTLDLPSPWFCNRVMPNKSQLSWTSFLPNRSFNSRVFRIDSERFFSCHESMKAKAAASERLREAREWEERTAKLPLPPGI